MKERDAKLRFDDIMARDLKERPRFNFNSRRRNDVKKGLEIVVGILERTGMELLRNYSACLRRQRLTNFLISTFRFSQWRHLNKFV